MRGKVEILVLIVTMRQTPARRARAIAAAVRRGKELGGLEEELSS